MPRKTKDSITDNSVLDDNDKSLHKARNQKKKNITLSVDEQIVQDIRSEASELNQSLNVRMNEILRKHVKFYRMAELNGAAVIHPILVQFMIGEIDESKFIEQWKELGNSFVEGYFTQKRIPFTFDNFIKYHLEELAIYAGVIKRVSKYVDEYDGKTCLFLLHGYDSKWSRIIGAAYSAQIEKFLNVHTTLRTFPDSVEIKIVEKVI